MLNACKSDWKENFLLGITDMCYQTGENVAFLVCVCENSANFHEPERNQVCLCKSIIWSDGPTLQMIDLQRQTLLSFVAKI
jgi:hypothetical protein